jgi:hypothetical protein
MNDGSHGSGEMVAPLGSSNANAARDPIDFLTEREEPA